MSIENEYVSERAIQPTTQQKLDMLCEWINGNIERPIGWTELIEKSGMDHLELQACFSTYYKTTPMQWIRSRRLHRSKQRSSEISTTPRWASVAKETQ
jgi:transcriptional regulator GlxA family with amidase domain